MLLDLDLHTVTQKLSDGAQAGGKLRVLLQLEWTLRQTRRQQHGVAALQKLHALFVLLQGAQGELCALPYPKQGAQIHPHQQLPAAQHAHVHTLHLPAQLCLTLAVHALLFHAQIEGQIACDHPRLRLFLGDIQHTGLHSAGDTDTAGAQLLCAQDQLCLLIHNALRVGQALRHRQLQGLLLIDPLGLQRLIAR